MTLTDIQPHRGVVELSKSLRLIGLFRNLIPTLVFFIYLNGIQISLFATQRDEIRIGANISLSGTAQSGGLEQKWTYETAIADINSKGGIFVKAYGKRLPVRLIIVDDESDPGKAVMAVKRLIGEHKIDFILGGASAPFGVIPACITAEKHQIYYHTSISLIPPWEAHKFKWSTLFFFDLNQACDLPFTLWDSLPESERPKRPGLLMENTFDGRAFARVFRKLSEERGYQFVFDEVWKVGLEDYTSLILKAKARNIDSLLIFGSEEDAINLVKRIKANRLNLKYLHSWKGLWAGDTWNELGEDTRYIMTDGFWSPDFPFPGARHLGERYFNSFGQHTVSAGALYALCQVLFEAIEIAGTLNSADVRNAVINNTFRGTVMGDVDYNEAGIATFISTANQWRDGKQVLIHPFKWTEHHLTLAPPWSQR